MARWRTQALTAPHAAEIARLAARLTCLRACIAAILDRAQQMRGHTIDDILAMPDAALGLDVLLGRRQPHADARGRASESADADEPG